MTVLVTREFLSLERKFCHMRNFHCTKKLDDGRKDFCFLLMLLLFTNENTLNISSNHINGVLITIFIICNISCLTSMINITKLVANAF